MDYDRALFRVYERAIEDIGATPSLFATSGQSSSPEAGAASTQQQQQQPLPPVVPFSCAFVEIYIPQWFGWIRGVCYSTLPCLSPSYRYRYSHLEVSASGAGGNSSNTNSLPAEDNETTEDDGQQTESLSGAPNATNHQNNIVTTTSTTDRFRQRALARMHAMRSNTANAATNLGSSNHSNDETSGTEDLEEGMSLDPQHEGTPLRQGQDGAAGQQEGEGDDNNETDATTTNGEIAAVADANRFLQGNDATTDDDDNNNNNTNDHQSEINTGCSQKALYMAMQVCLWAALYNVAMIVVMHSTYVRPDIDGGILGMGLWNPSLKLQKEYHTLSLRMPPPPPGFTLFVGEDSTNASNARDNTSTTKFASRASAPNGGHNIDFYKGPTCIEYALASRPPQLEWNVTSGDETLDEEDQDDKENDPNGASTAVIANGDANNTTKNDIFTGNWTIKPLLRDDEVLYIQIIYNAKKQCSAQGYDNAQCSRTHVCNRTTTTNETNADVTLVNEGDEGDSDNSGNATAGKWESNEYWTSPMYKFSTMEALMYTPDHFLYHHNVSIVNVTLTERCLSMGSDLLNINPGNVKRTAEVMTQIYGVMDTVIINQMMYGIRDVDGSYRNGFLQNMRTDERWSWSRGFMELSDSREPTVRATTWWTNKLFGTLFVSVLGFFLVTSVTALIVRILTSSGVVLMFPMFALFRAMGLPGADDRLLGMSYPWIGRAQHAIRRQRLHSEQHLIWAHIAKITLFYVMYEACQGAWSMVLYGKSIPAGLPVWVYGFAMIWEYYSMVFVRSALR
jgi:hypothetical protein